MQVSVENLSSVKKVLHIEVPEEEVTREVNRAYNELKRTAKIKGFRPGKAPRAVLERHFRKDVDADVASKLIQESFADAVRDGDLRIVGQPRIDPPDLSYRAPYRFDATVEVVPELGPVDYRNLSLRKTEYNVTEADIENQLEALRKNVAEQRTVAEDRPLAEGDFALVDFEALQDGKSFEPLGTAENVTLKMGENTIAPGLDAHLIGLNVGDERTFEFTFPEDHKNPDVAGQTVQFRVKLNEIREEVLPPVDDELAKKFGKFESLEELREEISKNMTEGYEKRTEQELNEQLFSGLLERVSFEVPDALIEAELDGIVQETERGFSQRNMSLEDAGISQADLRERYRDTAESQVRRYLILQKVIEQEGLSATEEEVEAGLAEMARRFGHPVEMFTEYYKSNPRGLENFKHSLLEKKAIRKMLDENEIETVAATQSAAEEEEGA
ncbi:MAG: trigger factor [Desulfococcaceae bacterium]